ncbi:MAG: Aldo-keto reductase IolS [Chlamydiales bacterium]|nr:Aldo-keto reductase IolS [Chlamydiales bacterium]
MIAQPFRLERRLLGRNGPEVPVIGLGCMGMSEFYGPVNIPESLATLKRALELGCNFFDTAALYGLGHNERLLGTCLHGVARETYFLATKCGVRRDPKDLNKRIIDNSPEHIQESCTESLVRLGTDYIDLYYLHRIARDGAGIEASMRAMADLLAEDKIRYVGLSEASQQVIERANSALLQFTDGRHHLAAVQTEYSLMSRTPEIDGTIQVCRELGIAFVPYAPLGRQYLTALGRTSDFYDEGDCRKMFPRFHKERMGKNQGIVRRIVDMAAEKECTPAQLCLAWVLAQGDHMIPIPGTKQVAYLEENLLATQVKLTAEDMRRLDEAAPIGAFSGTRYPEHFMQSNHLKSDAEVIKEHGRKRLKK